MSAPSMAGGNGHTLSEGWPAFASAPPGCLQAGLLGASSASRSQGERTDWRRPGAWPNFCLPQLVAGSTRRRPTLVSVCSAAACSPPTAFLLSLSLLRSLPRIPLLNLVPQNLQQSRAEQSTRRVSLFPPPQAEKQDSVCQLKKELISMAFAVAAD